MTPTNPSPNWRLAASFAARAHAGQIRKDGVTPYIAHPYRVAMTVRETFGCDDPVCICAAILHDTIEDTTTDYDDILEEFGEDVAVCVAALSKDMRLSEGTREPSYDEQIARGDWRVKLVKLADVLDNLLDIRTDKRKNTLERHLPRCQRAIDLAKAAHDAPEVLDLARVIVEEATARAASERG